MMNKWYGWVLLLIGLFSVGTFVSLVGWTEFLDDESFKSIRKAKERFGVGVEKSLVSGERKGVRGGQVVVGIKQFGLDGTRQGDIRELVYAKRTWFTCSEATSDPSLSWELLNDGFCDCPGTGFDEPGTAACAGFLPSKTKTFYCGVDHDIYIFPSRVGDGVCDCCDGSDEKSGVCKNDCKSIISEREARQRKEREGMRLGEAWVAAHRTLAEKIFKKGKVPLSAGELQEIFEGRLVDLELQVGEYAYKIEESRVTQTSRDNKDTVVLGRNPAWDSSSRRIEFSQGTACFNGKVRAMSLLLECGSKLELKYITEPETCLYEGNIVTPLGCYRQFISR
mmetsp:Transcript_18197/g.30991  ORF Transcript_18197/g.30991 Transcript_18197/m.30991 type:complete len:337 (-) Transcript_18197:3950-4960(-)